MPVAPTICGVPLSGRRHICAFFSEPGRAYDVLIPFIQEGLSHRERVLNVVPTGATGPHLQRLHASGALQVAPTRDEQLVVKEWHETYLLNGGFCAQDMHARVVDAVRAARSASFDRLRCWGDMGWVGPNDLEEVARYEQECDTLSLRFPDDVFVCCYNSGALAGETIARLAALHPLVIFDGTLYVNR